MWTTALHGFRTAASAVTGKDQATAPFQLWRVGYPGGDVLNVTKDANTYDPVSVTADASTLLTVRISETSALFVAPLADLAAARRLTSDAAASFYGLDWTADGRILYGSNAGGHRSIWVASSEGSSCAPRHGRVRQPEPGLDARRALHHLPIGAEGIRQHLADQRRRRRLPATDVRRHGHEPLGHARRPMGRV